MFRRLIAPFGACAVLCLVASAQAPSGYVPVFMTRLLDVNGNPANGTITAQILVNGQTVGTALGGGGQITARAIPFPVVNGSFSINLPDTSRTRPLVCIALSGTATDGSALLGSGYECVQPTSATNDWCMGGVCSLDNYTPSSPSVAPYTPGPKGDTGIGVPGSTIVSTGNGSNGNWTLSGIATFQSACRSIEDTHHVCITSPPFYGWGSTVAISLSSAANQGDTTVQVGSCQDFAPGQGVLFGNMTGYTGTLVNRVVSCTNGVMVLASQMAAAFPAGTAVNHDNTAAFQTAINLLPSRGSLHIMGPQGTYLLNGQFQDTGNANAVLVLPPNPIAATSATVVSNPALELTIEGDIVPTGLGQNTGLILQTYATNGASGQGGAFIRGRNPSASGIPLDHFTSTNLTLLNARLRSYGGNTISMLDAYYLAALGVEHAFIDTGADGSTDPRSVGIAWPGLSNNVRQYATDVTCVGYQTCYKPGEHFEGHGLNAANCGVKVFADGGAYPNYPSNSNLMSWTGWSENCGTIVKSGANPTVIEAHEQMESVLGYGVDDAPNLLHGSLWFEVPYTQGAVTKYSGSINGASWLQIHNLQYSVNEGGFGHVGFGNFQDIAWKIGSMTDSSGGSGNVFVQIPPQHVLILPQPNQTNAPQFNGYQTNALANFTGSSLSVRALIAADAQNPQGLTSARFLVGPGSGQYFGIEVTAGNTRLMNGSTVITSRAYSSATDKYWRIRVSGGTLYADTSGTGDFGSWKNLGSLAPSWPLSSGVLVQLEGGSYGTVYTPGLTDFSEFQFGAGQTVSSN